MGQEEYRGLPHPLAKDRALKKRLTGVRLKQKQVECIDETGYSGEALSKYLPMGVRMPHDEKGTPRGKSRKGVSRRDFIKLVGLSAAAGAATAAPLSATSLAAPAGIEGGAENIYSCKDSLNRFAVKNFAFKKVSEEMGEPWMKPWFGNMLKNAKNSKIGGQVPVKDPREARAHIALWVASSTWNRLSGPYGDGLENQGFLSWKPLGVPPMLLGNPDPNPDPKDLTKKIKQIARFVGANMVGVAKLNRKWVYDEACRNA